MRPMNSGRSPGPSIVNSRLYGDLGGGGDDGGGGGGGGAAGGGTGPRAKRVDVARQS